MLTYILITFPRNVYHSNGFSENSLIYGNVHRTCLFGVSLRGLHIVLQPPHLCSLHTCSPKAQTPKGIIQESLVLQPSQYSQRTKTCFWPPEVITSPTCYICYSYQIFFAGLCWQARVKCAWCLKLLTAPWHLPSRRWPELGWVGGQLLTPALWWCFRRVGVCVV